MLHKPVWRKRKYIKEVQKYVEEIRNKMYIERKKEKND